MRCDVELVGRPLIGTLEARGGLPRWPAEGTNSDAELGMDSAIGDGVDQRLMVNLILVGVRTGEGGDGAVESITRAEVGSDGKPGRGIPVVRLLGRALATLGRPAGHLARQTADPEDVGLDCRSRHVCAQGYRRRLLGGARDRSPLL
jgi:hypothetical protein